MMSLAANPKVIVVGGGIAGLTAAYQLHKKGVDVELYEAKNRVGGRILSAVVCGEVGELGGQNLFDGGEAKSLLRLIAEMGLEVEENKTTPAFRCLIDGKLKDLQAEVEQRQFKKEMLLQELEEIAAKSKNMRDVLLHLFPEKDLLYQVFSIRLAGFEGAPPEDLSIRYIETLYYMLLGGLASVHAEPELHLGNVKGGNNLLTERLAQHLQIHLNHPLTALRKVGAQYELEFKTGETKRADFVVLAIPSSVYEDIAIDEQVIPPKKLSAIQNIHFGTNAKILVYAPILFDKRPFTNDRLIAFNWKKILTFYYIGQTGKFTPQTINEVYQRDSAQIENCMEIPPISNQRAEYAQDLPFIEYGGPVGYSWTNDPYIKGSYSCIAPGQEALLMAVEEVDGEIVKTLFKPIDHLYFAGEHACALLDVPGTMEAACESGEKVARMIERTLRVQ